MLRMILLSAAAGEVGRFEAVLARLLLNRVAVGVDCHKSVGMQEDRRSKSLHASVKHAIVLARNNRVSRLSFGKSFRIFAHISLGQSRKRILSFASWHVVQQGTVSIPPFRRGTGMWSPCAERDVVKTHSQYQQVSVFL